MFSEHKTGWNTMKPVHILTLRACAPKEVFTTATREAYLSLVEKNPELTSLSSFLFKDDYQFLNTMPEDLKKDFGPQLKVLMQLVYQKGIRPADSRIRI